MKSTLRTGATVGVLAGMLFAASCNSNDNANTNAANTNKAVVTNTNTTANTNAAKPATADYTTPDGIITAKTKMALIADKDASAFDVDVDTAASVVTLSGKVATEAEKAASERVAKGISGVKSVNNQIQVVPDAKSDVVADSDDNIKKAVNDLLDNDAVLKPLGLAGEVNAGVVTLKGTVKGYADAVHAATALRKIKGVKQVVTSAVKVDADSNNTTAATNANTNKK